MTIQEKIQILSTDFLDRDQGTLVKSRTTGRLNWEASVKDGAYSSFILAPKTPEELITNAYRLASDMITVMDIPDKVTVRISADNSATDSKTVWVATKVFDDSVLTVGKKLDTFIGLAVHEGCHLLYTDFRATSGANSTIKALTNIIEDERIERECGESRPGLANFLAAAKYYYFDLYRQELLAQGKLADLDTPHRLLNTILSYIRYPKALDKADVLAFADVLIKAREVLTPFPSSTSEASIAATKIFDAMKDYLMQLPDEQQPSQQQGQGSGDSTTNQQTSDSQESSQSSGEQESQSSSNTQQSVSDKSEEIDHALSQMGKAIHQLTREPGSAQSAADNMSETIKKEGGKVALICEGRLERGTQRNTYVTKASDNKATYQQSLDRVRQYIPAVGRSLRCSSNDSRLCLRGMRSGTLDTGKLAEAYQGVSTVYMLQGEVKADRMAVCILIDESGSMYGKGELAARDTAVLLNEALNGLPNVDLYIYGHTAGRRKATTLYVYRERGFHNRYALGSTDSREGNYDSVAIREAAARVRKHTSEQCLFVMISDGAPNEAPELVRKAVQDVSKDKFDIVAVSIEPHYDPSTMYGHNIIFSDLSKLSIQIGNMVKKVVLKKSN